jgi:probable F420-dependent oxidoreductase
MKLGLSLASAASVVADARFAEEAGFDFVAVGEHLFFHSPGPNPFVQLAAAAGATTRIRLVSTVSLLPLYPAALAAKLAATLDLVSGGRFEFGVGLGGEYPREFEAVGVDPAARFRRLDEALHVLRLLFSGERVSFDGAGLRLRDVRLDPPPVQPGGPPIWLGGRKAGAIRRAGRFAHTWMPYMMTPPMLAESLADVRAAAAQAGREPADVRGAIFAFACCDADAAWARQVGIDAVSANYQQDFTPLADRYLVLGNPGQVIARLREYQRSGAEVAILHLAVPEPGDARRVFRTVAEQVLPELQRG